MKSTDALVAALYDADIGAVVHGPASEVSEVGFDSREVRTGELFSCIVGADHDGHDHAAEALDSGAAALLVQRRLDLEVAQIVVDDVRRAIGICAAEVHGWPSRELDVIGVTGTNGKTTTVHLIDAVCDAASRRSITIGTLTGTRTTPEAPELQRILRRAVDDGVEVVAMEVSSHAIDQHRIGGLEAKIGVFTNLGQDHLDYHGTMEAYFRAKAAFFVPSYMERAVVDVDQPYGRLLADVAEVEVFAISNRDLEIIEHRIDGNRFVWQGRDIDLPLGGPVNVRNAHAAAEACRLLGIDPDAVVRGLNAAETLPGRFQPVPNDAGLDVVVDYAHTPDALDSLLDAARQLTGGRVIVVFGCGGDRDSEKRPVMGSIAERGADVVIVTSDNPRGEDARTIIDDIVAGMTNAPHAAITDRREAIAAALGEGRPGDLILLAGKGHETTQTIGDDVLPFDDAKIAGELSAVRS